MCTILFVVYALCTVQCTTEKFKSDDEVQISAEDKDTDAEVDIFLNEKICKMFCSVTCSEGWY